MLCTVLDFLVPEIQPGTGFHALLSQGKSFFDVMHLRQWIPSAPFINPSGSLDIVLMALASFRQNVKGFLFWFFLSNQTTMRTIRGKWYP
jgi:hypothetical protein